MNAPSGALEAVRGRCRRVRFPGPTTVEMTVEDVEGLRPGAGEVLVRNLFTLVSPGTELALFTGEHVGFKDPENRFAKYPVLPGYAAVGRVASKGPDVPLDLGALVYHEGRHASHEIVALGPRNVRAAPAACDPMHVPFARLALIAATAVNIERVDAGTTVLVVGLGLIGNLAAQLFRLAGARVVGCDISPERREIARRCGIERVIEGGTDAALREVGEGGARAHIVVESTGAPSVVADCLALTRPLGTTILLGSTRGVPSLDVYRLVHRTGAKLVGAHVNQLPALLARRGGTTAALTVDLLDGIAAGRIVVAPLLSAIVKPDDLGRAYARMRAEPASGLGVLIDWRETE